MNERNIINSSTLREKFPQYYERLFSNCQVVASASDSFFWTGGYGRFFGGATVQQKLPTKNYIGLEIIPEKKIAFAHDLYGYFPKEDKFKKVSFDPAKERRLLKFLEVYWNQLDHQRKIKGFRIHILSESHCGGGLGTTGVVLSCLATCILLLAKKLTPEEITSWELLTTSELLFNQKYAKFSELFRFAWKLTAISRDGISSGATCFAALIKTPYPIIYMSEAIYNYASHPSIADPDTTLDSCSIIDQLSFWGGKLEEVFDLRLPLAWPIDVGRIFSGTMINTENILKSVSEIKYEHEEVDKFVKSKLSETLGFRKTKNPPYFFDKSAGKDIFWKDYTNILNLASLQTLSGLGELFEHGLYEANLRKFFKNINQEQELCHYLGTSTLTLDKICIKLDQEIAKFNEYNLGGSKIEGIGKGGHVLFVAPAGSLPDEVLGIIDDLKKNLKKEIFLDWASWIDGFGEDGIVVEQDLYAHIYSDYITPGCCRVITYQHEQTPQIEITAEVKIPAIIKNYDLLLDRSRNKIYVRGKRLSSKDIPSSSSTITILKILLRNQGKQVSNRDLGELSYAKSRYDLQSKIFIPLAKTLKKRTKKDLHYKISGGIYDNYWTTFDPKNLKIGILEKIE